VGQGKVAAAVRPPPDPFQSKASIAPAAIARGSGHVVEAPCEPLASHGTCAQRVRARWMPSTETDHAGAGRFTPPVPGRCGGSAGNLIPTNLEFRVSRG
jgi:hypothetical protein